MAGINWTDITQPSQLLAAANDPVGGWFWTAMAFLIWFVSSVMFLGYGIERALLVGGFFGLVSSMLLVYMDLMLWEWCLFFLGILLIDMLYIIWSSNRDM